MEDVHTSFIQYYQQLFTSGGANDLNACLSGVEVRVSHEMNTRLLANFTVVEVEAALGQMHPLKSSGPDGFAACFYQSSWPIVGQEVCTTVLDFLNCRIFDPVINNTFVALIPKKKNPSCVTNF